MAITDITEFAHLTDEEVAELGREFEAIRSDIEASLGADDAGYIRSVIGLQRRLEVAARITLLASILPPAWLAGTSMLSLAKILENMEIGHNVMHGQWDWMNDPEIHSGTWEWDNVCPAELWKHSHNVVHHTFTNVIGRDNDVGYGILRVAPEQTWTPATLGQPVVNALLALLFEWGVALHDLEVTSIRGRQRDRGGSWRRLRLLGRKVRHQVVKDYVVFPLLSGPSFLTTLTANATANVVRNLWSNMIIFCGHFPDGAEKFTEEELDGETRPEWFLRQLLGSANFEGGRALHVLSGSLGYQIEHHLYPDLPSNRYPEIAERVRDLCDRYGLAYTTGPLAVQYAQTLRTILRLSLPGGGPREGAGDTAPGARSTAVATPVRRPGTVAPQAAAS